MLSINSKDFLYIFVHIPKCAGSTLNIHIKQRYKEEERFNLSSLRFGVKHDQGEFPRITKEQVFDLFQSMPINQRNQCKVIYGHNAYYGVHEFFEHKIPRYFTLLRCPVKQTISRYNFVRSKPPERQKSRNIMQDDGTIVPLEGWIESEGFEANYMVKFLARMYTGKKLFDANAVVKEEELEDAKNMLNQLYFVGIVENGSDMDFIYNRLGINFNLGNKNISPRFFKSQDYEKTKYLVESRNKLDVNLYNYAIELNKEMVEKISDYNRAVSYTRTRRNISQIKADIKQKIKAILQ